MKITIDLKKSLQENADEFFEASKKCKRKLAGLEKALKEMEAKLEKAKEKHYAENEKKEAVKKRKREWYEKFRWFISTDGFLVIGGRDATSNESLVKKYMDNDDLYFHAEIHGAPHVIVKAEGKEIPEKTKKEAAIFAATFSSAWKEGLPYVDVYSVKPEQVSKEAPSGESLGKGAFVIRGKREYFSKSKLECAVGIERKENMLRVVSGPVEAVKKNAEIFFEIVPGKKEKSDVAKKLKWLFENKIGEKIDLDEIVLMLPSGNSEIKE